MPRIAGALVAVASTIQFNAVNLVCFLGQEAENTAFPYIVVRHDGEEREYDFERDWIDTGEMTFLVYCNEPSGAANCETIASSIEATFEPPSKWAAVTAQLSLGTLTGMSRTRYTIQPEEQRDANGNMVFRAEVGFQTKVTGNF